MIEITLHGKNGSRTLKVKSPRGVPTRHVRTRTPAPLPEPTHAEPPVPAKSEAKVSTQPAGHGDTSLPICPVLAALHKLTTYYPGGDGYFILDEIFLTVRQECTTFTRDALLETLRAYYRSGDIAFRQGYGSQRQFALRRHK